MFHLTFALPCVYVLLRFLAPLPWPILAKLLLAIVLIGVSQYHLWSRLSSGSVFSPEFPRFVVLLFNWAFGAILFLALIQLAMDLVGLLAWLVRRDGLIVPTGARYGAAVAAMALAAVAVHQATRVPALRDVEIAVRGLSARFDGYRLVQLTDLHISRLFTQDWARAVVERTNALEADLVTITGDFIDGSLDARRADVEPLRALRAPDGVWMVPGNHEYFFDADRWIAHFAGMGMGVLANRHTVLEREGAVLVLAGVTDLSAPGTGHPGPDLAAALAGAPAGAPVLLLDHQPRNARRNAAGGAALQLSGHTHGGMILGFDRLLARANEGFVSGRYDLEGGSVLYVSNGTALWPGFALRLGRPAELTRITLRAAP